MKTTLNCPEVQNIVWNGNFILQNIFINVINKYFSSLKMYVTDLIFLIFANRFGMETSCLFQCKLYRNVPDKERKQSNAN